MKKKNIINILIGIAVVFYIIFGTNALDDIKNSTASVINAGEEEAAEVNSGEELMVYFLDVGQADSILIRAGNNNMLIDAGNNEDGALIVSYLKELGVEQLDYVVGTHPHEDHIGGMDDIINNFDIETYMMPDVLSTTKTFEDVLTALSNNNLTYLVPKEGSSYDLGSADIKIIYVGEEGGDLNDASIVLKLTYGDNSFLFTGDATSNVEEELLESNANIKSDVLKVAHHGSDYSSTNEFIDAVNPEYAVISVGKNNSYNHPSLNTLEKFSKRNIKVYRTDEDNTIIFTSNGSDLTITTESTNTNG